MFLNVFPRTEGQDKTIQSPQFVPRSNTSQDLLNFCGQSLAVQYLLSNTKFYDKDSRKFSCIFNIDFTYMFALACLLNVLMAYWTLSSQLVNRGELYTIEEPRKRIENSCVVIYRPSVYDACNESWALQARLSKNNRSNGNNFEQFV